MKIPEELEDLIPCGGIDTPSWAVERILDAYERGKEAGKKEALSSLQSVPNLGPNKVHESA